MYLNFLIARGGGLLALKSLLSYLIESTTRVHRLLVWREDRREEDITLSDRIEDRDLSFTGALETEWRSDDDPSRLHDISMAEIFLDISPG